ncbi:MAG: discoidin domain-containing protein [Balneolaceae bacterium]
MKNIFVKTIFKWVFIIPLLILGCSGLQQTQQQNSTQNQDFGAGPGINIQKDVVIELDGNDTGRHFDGLGALSAGGSSRLLVDYPEKERNEILDYLFKPGYGASMQILKVEIGGETNSTSGSEASHMRSPDEINCNRGYEWWLMKEAKKRNPDITLAALQWGTPGWVGEFWSDENIEYNIEWLECAEENNLKIDYVGGWNEHRWDADWYIAYKKALDAYNPDIKIIGADDVSHPFSIVAEMADNPELVKAVDIVGEHSLCGWRGAYRTCESTEDAVNLNKPIWSAEQSTMGTDTGAPSLARSANRLYIQAHVTGNIAWALISAWYSNLPIADTGLMLAEWPWSGYYHVGKDIWVYAHTTQFTEPGWFYMDNAAEIMQSQASYVTLRAPDNSDFTSIIEAMDLDIEQTITYSITDDLPDDKEVHLWASDIYSDNQDDHFAYKGSVMPEDGKFHLTIQPGYLYTLSTTTGQGKGNDKPDSEIYDIMKLPYSEDFEDYEQAKLARYFSDVNGSYETAPCRGGREGMCYSQMTYNQPVIWNGRGNMRPTTVMGDPSLWGDYEVSTDIMLEDSGHVELVGRVDVQHGVIVGGYHLKIGSDRNWELYRRSWKKNDESLLSGNVPFEINEWHQIALRMIGQTIEVIIDNEMVGSVENSYNVTGQIALITSKWAHAQFDNVKIEPTGPGPDFISKKGMKATATSEENPEFPLEYIYSLGYEFTADKAIDGRPETAWHSSRTPNRAPLPQSVIIDMGNVHTTQGLSYRPNFISHSPGGIMTGYNIYLSRDGNNFEKVASGEWPEDVATKLASWPEQQARYVKLEGVKGASDMLSASEIDIFREYSELPPDN